MNESIVPFADLAAKRANDQILERMRGVPANADGPSVEIAGNPNIGIIEQLLIALEGMQTQIQALTELVREQDKRIEKLERRKIIRGVGS